jgi:nitric oxide reductase NorD protein
MTRYREKILALFDMPIYTSTGVRRMEDLDAIGICNVLDGCLERHADRVIHGLKPVASICPELTVDFLAKFIQHRDLMKNGFLAGWIEAVLDIYDKKGIQEARHAVLHPEECRDVKCLLDQGVHLKDIIRILQFYMDGLGAKEIKLAEGETHYTDTFVIYLPSIISIFPDNASNFLLYKLMVTHKWVQIRLGTFEPPDGDEDPDERAPFRTRLSYLLSRFPDGALARDLFQLLDTLRMEAWIFERLPGLHRDLINLKKSFAAQWRPVSKPLPKSILMTSLIRMHLGEKPASCNGTQWTREAAHIWELFGLALRPEPKPSLPEKLLTRAYEIASGLPGPYQSVQPGLYMGELRLEAVEEALGVKIGSQAEGERETIQTTKKTFGEHRDVHKQESSEKCDSADAVRGKDTHLSTGESEPARDETCPFNPGLTWEIPDPSGTLSAVNESEVFYFDEWDFRRQGYRKNWTRLREFQVQEGDLCFSENVLNRHRWTIKNIRDQFERIRMHDISRRRQKEGDDIDLDAVVENFCQIRAGGSPSENLYMRLNRDERDICTVFLIDMSRSTKGTINLMERSALLILAKALETLNDRFAIYGFSGQTRNHCELFHIKSFHESFGDRVMRRIAGLRPRNCTRIGPPIRRLTDILHPMAARNKLLVTLTDGKPYDHDGYLGEYAVADTQQAIMEAKRKGIVPFCVTIDTSEHAYLSRMYGDGHYIFIDDISKIPQMMPRIYINLTT